MESRRRTWTRKFIVCIASWSIATGCGDNGELDDGAAPACTVVRAAGPWWNRRFPEQAKMFHAEFDATPSASSIDAVVGLGGGRASSVAQLAATVRFNLAGTIDARAGSEYRADATMRYQAGVRYHLRLDVEVRTHTYSVWLRNAFGTYDPIARGYPFRTEKAGVTRLNHVASKVDSASGTLEICGFQVVADATTADRCVIATAGDGFVSVPLPGATILSTVTFNARPSAADLDAVIGLSAGPATSASALATAVRFTPSGLVDACDGDRYRADVPQPYGTQGLDVRMIADLTSHTYSVFEGTYLFAQELARQYGFRAPQRAVTHLDRLSAIVDSPQGSVTICTVFGTPSTGVAYSREGHHAVLPLADDQALVSDGATTWRLDAGGQVLGQVARGGELAADVQGDVFVASVAGTTLTVDKYDPDLVWRWRATQTVLAGTTIQAMTTEPCGDVLIATASPQDGRVAVARFTAGGVFASLLSRRGDRVTLDGDQPIVAWSDSSTLQIARFDLAGSMRWTRTFAGQASITALAVDPSHGVLFGGELYTAMDFGGGTLPLMWTPDGFEKLNGYVVKLSATGAHVFSKKTGDSLVGGIAANGSQIVVSSTLRTQFHYAHLLRFDATGTPVPGTDFDTGFGENGLGDRVWIGASGRVWWDLDTQWPLFPRWPYLVVVSE